MRKPASPTRPLAIRFLSLTGIALTLATGHPVQARNLHLSPIGTYDAGGETSSEISAHDPRTQRLFSVNGAAGTVDVLSIANPTQPTKLYSIDVTPWGKAANSVAFHLGTLAVAVEARVKTDPGKAVFFDANGNYLNAVTVGALPDMITFTPNGRLVLVANEGEPSNDYRIDPEGSVSIIPVSPGMKQLRQADVIEAGFRTFNNTPLPPGMRIFGPNATPAQDLEPEYIAVSHDSRTAWVTLQENNAMAVLDLQAGRFTTLLPLGYKNHDLLHPTLQTFTFDSLPPLGTTAAGQPLTLGGFSGLFFEGLNPLNGAWQFLTHGDRGPNAEPVDVDGDGTLERPFPLPHYQPEIIRFELDPHTGILTLTDRLPLTRQDGTPLSGLPNLAGTPGLAHADEKPVDLFGQPLGLDPLGADLEGIAKAPDGTFWMVDEYRPSLYHFDPTGRLIKRYVPEGSNSSGTNTGEEKLPAVFAQRRANRGFEAVAWNKGRVYAFIQSPLDNPDKKNDASSKASKSLRILEFDPVTETTTAQFLYLLDPSGSDKIGDAVAIVDKEFFVIERDDALGTSAAKKIFRISLEGATNLQTLDPAIVGPGGTLELLSPSQLAAARIQPVRKDLHVNLATLGYNSVDKPEGLALIHPNLLAVLNDNDYGLEGSFDVATGLLTPNPDPFPSVLGLIHLTNYGLDASDRDGKINIRPWRVKGMFQPDAIATWFHAGQTYLLTANEGDARDYQVDGKPVFAEEARVKDLPLDPIAFPDAANLRLDANLGRLTVTKTLGDPDRDGDYDTLYAFGGRSFSLWTADGAPVFDSADELEQLTATTYPANFNAGNSTSKFDDRSDNKGPEPETVTVGRIRGRDYAFIGLERVGGVVVYELVTPQHPRFVGYFNNRDLGVDGTGAKAGDLGPEGLLFIPQHASPNGADLLVVSNEISGTTTIFRIDIAD